MFTSYLFVPEPKRVLLVGVGAGSMIRFLAHHDPGVEVDAVEIDPVVLDVARDYFGTRSSMRVHLIVEDGFDFIDRTTARYDVIYLDAFLKPFSDADPADPAVDTDSSGVPRRLKTIETYRQMQTKLAPGGVVVVNLHYHTLSEDVATLRQAFVRGHLFDVPGSGNFILVGTSDEAALTEAQLVDAGRRADQRLRADFSFGELGRRLLLEVPSLPNP
jgi:spermidine synthase